MISPRDSISETSLKRRLDAKNLIKNIRDIGHQINLKNNIPLITDLKVD